MQAGSVLRVRTISTVHFLGACAQNAALTESILIALLANGGAGGGLAAGGHTRSRLHELRILSVENLAWAVELYGTPAFPETTPTIDNEIFLGRWEFTAADGRKDTADSFWKYWVPGLDLSYQDMALTGTLNVRLINRSVASKTANAGGAVVVEFGFEPTQGI